MTNQLNSGEHLVELAALRVTAKTLRTLFEQAAVGVSISRHDGAYLDMNTRFCEIVGYSKEELLHKNFREITHPDDLDLDNRYAERRELGEIDKFGIEKRYLHKNGQPVWVTLYVSALRDDSGHVNRVVTVAVDITERKRAEDELRRLKDQLQAENTYLREEIQEEQHFAEIIGQSLKLRYIFLRLEQVAPTNATVLILGETGTGKELIARAIHNRSRRKAHPLIKVNCAALPAHLIESELFGHEKGAFTGATARRPGRFELADGGSLFLDEIGELPLDLQAKLLRVLQDGEFERLGSSRTMHADVRIIAATNRDLETEMRVGRFRHDLYYRLNVYPVTLPPLRERPEDIPLLVRMFVKMFSKQFGKPIERIPQAAIDRLQQYPWPGNIRELRNVIERAIITAQDSVLRVDLAEIGNPQIMRDKTLTEVERDYIQHVLAKTQWTIQGPHGAARILGLDPGTLRSRMRKLGMTRPPRR